MQLSYRVHPGHGPFLFLVHGFLTGSAQWQDNIDALATQVTPVTIDLWGHGDSPTPLDAAAYHPANYLAEFERIRITLGAPRIYLCGYSLGAGLTLRYALTHPERIIAQAFTNSSSGLADADEQAGWKAGASAAAERIRAGGIAAVEALPVHPKRARHLPGHVYESLIIESARLSPEGVARTLEVTNPNASVRQEIARNTIRTLLLCGARESRFRAKRDFAARVMPALTVVDLPVGHGVNMENPALFNAALLEFLSSYRHAS
ncbi:MAG: alpha/beta fold hydrolase [Gammaproteobacteria bacterium]|nr:alpha/beta fold hydrolase [Gammaproteobacteria bacterium]